VEARSEWTTLQKALRHYVFVQVGRRGGKKKCDLATNSINLHDGNRLRWERPMLLRHATRPFCWAYKCFSNTQIDVGWFPVKGRGDQNVWLWERRCWLSVAEYPLGSTMARNHDIVTYSSRVAAELQNSSSVRTAYVIKWFHQLSLGIFTPHNK